MKSICFPKNEHGLDVVNLANWNKAAVLRHFWYLLAKAGSLWLAWVNMFLLKERSIWIVRIPQSCTWEENPSGERHRKAYDSFKVGSVDSIFLWHDS